MGKISRHITFAANPIPNTMKSNFDESTRNRCAVELFHSTIRAEMRNGLTYPDARKAAYDAVELRYFLSRKTLQNIMSKDPSVFHSSPRTFCEDNQQLIAILDRSNDVMVQTIERNNKLIEILRSI